MSDKTHYRKAFDSPYLSSADIVGPTNLTIQAVRLEIDQTKKTKDKFNTAHFAEEFLRPGERLKPMILNASNSKMLKKIAGSPFIEDWTGLLVTVYVDPNVRFGKETVEGLRIMPQLITKPTITPEHTKAWANAKSAYKRDGNLYQVFEKVIMSKEHEAQLIKECAEESQGV
jgi:hypothetical protein